MKNIEKGDILKFNYTNWQGKIGERRCIFYGVSYGSNYFHKEDQVLLRGFDLDKFEDRTYAVKDMTNVVVKKAYSV